MGQDQSRPPGFDFLDSGRLQPRTGNIVPTTAAATGSARASSTRSSGSNSNGSQPAPTNTSANGNVSAMQNVSSPLFANTNTSTQQTRRTRSASTSSQANFFNDDDSQMYTGASSADLTRNNINAATGGDRTALLEQRQDERRLQLMFTMMKLCKQEFASAQRRRHEQQQKDEENHPQYSSSSSSSSSLATSSSTAPLSLPFPTFEADAFRWSVYALLRACRSCGSYCPEFRNATLTGSQPTLVFICDDCAANSSLEAVNATVDSVAAAVARAPGFHGSAVSGTWQIPVVNHFDALVGNFSSSSLSVSSNNPSSSSAASGSNTAAGMSTFQQTYYNYGSRHNNNINSNNNSSPSFSSSSSEYLSQSVSSPNSSLSSSSALTNVAASTRYLLSALLYGQGPVAVHQGVSGTAVESCAFAAVLPGLELVTLSTTCNQRESDLERVRRLCRDRPNLRLAFEGRSFDDKSLMFLGSAPFRQNVTHLSVKHCDRITSAGFRLIATCFPNLRKINFRGSSNLDLDAFQEPITEESPNVLELLTVSSYENVVSSSPPPAFPSSSSSPSTAATTITSVKMIKNPLCRSLQVLDFSEGALQFETRVGVFGRLENLTELNLAGCENIHDKGIIDMFRQAVWSISRDVADLMPSSVCRNQLLRLCFPNANKTAMPLIESPLGQSEMEYLLSNYSSHVVTTRQGCSRFFNQGRHRFDQHAKLSSTAILNHDQRASNNFMAPHFKWLSKLNLSGLRHLTDSSIRWLCGSWISPDEYHRMLLTAPDERITLSMVSGSHQAPPATTATTTTSFSSNLQPSNFISVYAEKFCLIAPREVSQNTMPELMNILSRDDERNDAETNLASDDEQDQRRLNMLLVTPRNSDNNNNNNNNEENDDDERATAENSPRNAATALSMMTPRSSMTAETATSRFAFERTPSAATDHHHRQTKQQQQEEKEVEEEEVEVEVESEREETSQKKNVGVCSRSTDHHRSVTFERVTKLLNRHRDQLFEESRKSNPCISWLAPSLTELVLENCTSLTPISHALVLTSLPNLEVLNVSGNPDGFTDAVLRYVLTMSSCASVHEQKKSEDEVDDDGNAEFPIRPLLLPTKLRSLNMCRCSKVKLGNVCKLLKLLPSITELYGSPFVADDAAADDEENDGMSIGSRDDHTDREESNNNDEESADKQPKRRPKPHEIAFNSARRLRTASKSQVRILGLCDPEIALAFIKLLAHEARKKRNEILPEPGNLAHKDCFNASSSSSVSASSLLRSLYLPSTAKLAAEEANIIKTEALLGEGRVIQNDALARMSTAAVHHLLRDAKHQMNCDLEYHHVY